MKVFLVDKLQEEEDTKLLDTVENNIFIKISEEQKVNYITISNPTNSNKICIIEKIQFKIKDEDNKVKIMIGETQKITDKYGYEGTLNINYELKNDKHKYLEIDNISACKGQLRELVDKSTLIVLPEGCLFLEIEKAVSGLECAIKWHEEVINE